MRVVGSIHDNNNFSTVSIASTTNIDVRNYLSNTTDQLGNISGENIAIRKTINVADTINFKPFHSFNSAEEILYYFSAKLTRIYQENGIKDIHYKIKNFITYRQKNKFKVSYRIFNNTKEIYNFLCKLSLFIAAYLKTKHNNIANFIEYFFSKCSRFLSIQKDRILFFKDIPIANIQKIAIDKDLYRYIRDKGFKEGVSYDKLKQFSAQRQLDKNNKITAINQIISSCSSDSKKQIMLKYVNDILQICANKDIDINNEFIATIKELVTYINITDAKIDAIFKKIIIYLQAIDDNNSYADISVLTNIICSKFGKPSAQLLLSICNLTDTQLQSIVAINTDIITKYWFFTGFPTQKNFSAAIDDFNHRNIQVKKNVATTSQQLSVATELSSKDSPTTTITMNDVQHENTANKTASLAKKSKRLENIIYNIASNNKKFNTKDLGIDFK